MRTLFSAILLLALTGLPAFGQNKVATVDLKKLFDNYYKTKLATQAIQERANEMDKDYTTMAQDLKKKSDQYEQLLESASDPAVSDQERQHRKANASDLLKQLQDSKGAIDQYERQAQMTLTDQKQRMRDNILDEIKKTVAAQAKSGGYTLVLDSAAETVNGTPTVVFTTGEGDLTADVLKQLNAAAPPDLPESTEPAPVFLSTNTLPYNATPGLPGTQ
ncbi:MAG TPA: OmpH family outer membrane protein [Pseudomonadales bacterium]|nr:OmpH family outer membrane protein [Pseudomonadales bacterium]